MWQPDLAQNRIPLRGERIETREKQQNNGEPAPLFGD
jgi:hypothetical protein